MNTLTVFTPTYNRAYCLKKCYDSLVTQSNQDFVWLIIDDGSSDNTEELVKSWIDEKKIDIVYHYQTNLGMHGAHNAAYNLIETELNVCIDSDDYMADDAVDHILKFWEQNRNEKYAGIIGLDADTKGNIIGRKIPEEVKESTVNDIYDKHKAYGDKKLVYRTDIVKKYPRYPIFEGERFVPLGYLYQLIDQDYKVLTLNKVLCVVEYLEDGSSMNMLKQYRRHPKGFAFSRKSRMELAESYKEEFKNAIHYVSSSLFMGNKKFFSESPKKLTTFLAMPLGFLLNIYIRVKTKNDF